MSNLASCSGRAQQPVQAPSRTGAPARAARLVARAAVTVPSEFKSLKPVGERVLVKSDASEEKSAGGILLPASAQKKPAQGAVTSAGSAKAVREGDKVVYSKYAGTEVRLEGQDFIVLKEDDVVGIMASEDVKDLKPLGDRLLIEVVEADERSAGGILLTTASKDRPSLGKVIAVGSGKTDESGKTVKPNVEAQSTVLYSRYAGTEFTGANDTLYVVVKESDILATVS